MTFVVDGTNGLTFNDATTQSSTATNASNISSGTLGNARLPTGSVLQVVSAQPTSIATTSADAVIATLSITPSSASSKILILATVEGERQSGTAGNYIMGQLRKNGTNIRGFMNAAGYQLTTGARNHNSVAYIDSPATTSAITYDIFCDHTTASGVNFGWYMATIHALEIAS